jgi:hypothetical protein
MVLCVFVCVCWRSDKAKKEKGFFFLLFVEGKVDRLLSTHFHDHAFFLLSPFLPFLPTFFPVFLLSSLPPPSHFPTRSQIALLLEHLLIFLLHDDEPPRSDHREQRGTEMNQRAKQQQQHNNKTVRTSTKIFLFLFFGAIVLALCVVLSILLFFGSAT